MWQAKTELQTCRRGRREFQWRLDSEQLSVFHLLGFGVAFFIAYTYAMNMSQRSGAPFWLPDSVILCALLLSQPRSWPIYLAATLPLRLMFALPPNAPTWFLFTAFANDSLKGVGAAVLLRWMLAGRGIRFDCLQDFWRYLVATVVVTPALSGVAGAVSWVTLGREFWLTWRNWFLGDALANLVLTPLLFCLAVDWRKLTKARPIRYLEALAVFSGLIFAAQFAYHRDLDSQSLVDPRGFLPVPFLLLAAVRFGPAGASASLTIMSLLSVVSATATHPSSLPADDVSVLSIQLFLMVIGIPIMSLSVLIEQQRSTERSLRESEMRFRNMADTAPIMIWISGPDKLATFFNRGWLEFTGRSVAEELGYGWASSVHPDHRGNCLAGYTSAFDGRQLWHAECQLRRVDGTYRWMLCSGVPRFGADGRFEGYIVSVSDITDLKHAQEASLAGQKLESLGLLAGGVAHDFNNLLAAIQANAESAEASEADRVFPLEEVRNIKEISIRAAGIVRQLMIYAGNERSTFEPIDLSRLVKEMLGLVKTSISKSAILLTDLGKDLPAIIGNGPQIQQVVMNLVLNASDALAGRGGTIAVTTCLETATRTATFSSTAALPESKYVRLEVSDTGSGMSKEAQDRIFDPFFTTKPAGHGLGLSVVQGIVRTHKGSIELTSTPGQGTTFRILWPVATQAADRLSCSGPTSVSVRTACPNRTVLVVEDEHALRICITKMLRKEGLTVIEVDDGDAAVDLLRNHRTEIDLVLLDMTIPGTPSRTVVAEAGRVRPNTRLLLTSAYGREAIVPVVDVPQFRGFIRKPFHLRDLVTVIRKTLSD